MYHHYHFFKNAPIFRKAFHSIMLIRSPPQTCHDKAGTNTTQHSSADLTR